MSYSAEVIRVMIASPGDVSTERNLVRVVLAEWNAIHSFSRRIVLLPVGWESHTSPEMGGRPQEIINNQILKDCDLLVGIFWTRIGTATGGFASGSVEEIEEHIAKGKPAMLYFSDVPVVPSSVDQDQYRLLTKFRESAKGRGLIQTFGSVTEFKETFERQIQIKLNQDSYFVSRSASVDTPLPPASNKITIPDLSSEAKQLLIEAASAGDGHITYIRYLGGAELMVKDRDFLQGATSRTSAIWRGALDELIELGLVQDIGHKGEIFELTRAGYEAAEILGK